MVKRSRLKRKSGKKKTKRLKRGQPLYVGDLGESKFLGYRRSKTIDNNPLAVEVNKVLEEDGTISWQLNVERSDTLLATAWVEPLEEETIKAVKEGF